MSVVERTVWLSAVVFLLLCAGCKETKTSGDDPAGEKSVRGEAVKKNPAEEKEAPPVKKSQLAVPVVAKDDPLLGSWIVVEAQGQHSDVNEGLGYDFKSDGEVLVKGFEVRRDARALALTPDGKRIPKTTVWKWKRLGDSSIELSYGDIQNSAIITYQFEEDMLIFKWNDGGQVFKMKKI